MATAILVSARKNDKWGRDVECSFTETEVDGSCFRIPDDMDIVMVTACDALNAGTVQPEYSIDEGTTWFAIDKDSLARTYPETVAGSAVPKLPKVFVLPGGALFRLHSSASQTDKTWTGRVGR